MGRSAYWNFRGAGLASPHWATRTAVRVPGHDPRLALGSVRRTDPPERRASLVFFRPNRALRIISEPGAAFGRCRLLAARLGGGPVCRGRLGAGDVPEEEQRRSDRARAAGAEPPHAGPERGPVAC